eukprot:6256787-Pyramimonas_sp.AAC.1
MTVVAGGFNYVLDGSDRVSLTAGGCSGRRNAAEERDWLSPASHRRVKGVLQGSFTHVSESARSRRDRICCSIHPSGALSEHVGYA